MLFGTQTQSLRVQRTLSTAVGRKFGPELVLHMLSLPVGFVKKKGLAVLLLCLSPSSEVLVRMSRLFAKKSSR